ncbi:MAG: class I SAM-dependent methyltransferase [Blautia sp.]|nr:class I SAM-dependent methyltransferase [Blautia sp.]
MENLNPNEDDNVLDAGVAPVKGIAGAKTITNNFFEYLYPYTEKITATSIEDASNLEASFPGLTFVRTEPYHTPFTDNQFDAVFCNAVVEHTGTREQQKAFIEEYCRIGKKFFFTTPNRWFPVEVHSALPLIHWLPPGIFRKILKVLGKDALADEQILNLLTIKEFQALFPENVKWKTIHIRTFGMTSNIVIWGEKRGYGEWDN